MASLATVCRATARLARNRVSGGRGFTSSARCLAAQNFTMPALSPTMTEGNIANWSVKEGDAFSAGDVLLEIETDKATMDVEAQEDGIMMKIMADAGSKAVQVGSRIAVVAESGDDISSLEIPADEQPKTASTEAPKDAGSPGKESSSGPPEGQQVPQNSKSNETHEQKYPLLPSVEHLVHANGLSKDDITKIRPTGPAGRLLKGDVLAFLGSIKADIPAEISSRFDTLSHLDLSNIKVTEKKAPAASAPAERTPSESVEEEAFEINVPVSLAKVVETQKKIQDTLGVFLPLSTFITRAAEVANDDLPLANRRPTTDELFDQVLGLDKVKAAKGSRGVYLPQISAIPPPSALAPAPAPKKADIIDILASSNKSPSRAVDIPLVPGLSSGDNVFSLVVPRGEEKRAEVFLERCKVILEQEPGRLVL